MRGTREMYDKYRGLTSIVSNLFCQGPHPNVSMPVLGDGALPTAFTLSSVSGIVR